MKNLRNLPIRLKVNAMLILMSVAVLSMAITGFLSIHGFQLRERYRSEFETLTRLTADNLQAALLFDDRKFADEIFRNLTSSSAVVGACIERTDGSVFTRLDVADRDPERSGDDQGISRVRAPVIDEDNEVVGTLEIVFRTDGFRESIERSIRWGMWILLASLLLSVLIARVFHITVSFPLRKLTQAAIAVSQKEHPGKLDGEAYKDEIGVLVRAFNAMVTQITERDRQLSEAARMLEARVEERTNQLLVVADQAKVASKAKSEFLAIISHELRTPLNPILGYTSLLLSNRLNFENKEYVEGIRTEADRMLTLVDRILEFIKVEKGNFQCQESTFDLISVLERSLDQHLAAGDQVMLQFRCDIPDSSFQSAPTPLFVTGDCSMIERVVWNLLSNAIKFTQKGSVILRLGCTDIQTDCIRVRIEILDTGPGIPESYRTSLFEPFSQSDSSSTRPFGGMGLGLSVSKRLVDAMGGSIGYSCRPEGGSCFWFELPLQRTQGADRSE
jgi:two-component system, sensor histidine kinase and response regulator